MYPTGTENSSPKEISVMFLEGEMEVSQIKTTDVYHNCQKTVSRENKPAWSLLNFINTAPEL